MLKLNQEILGAKTGGWEFNAMVIMMTTNYKTARKSLPINIVKFQGPLCFGEDELRFPSFYAIIVSAQNTPPERSIGGLLAPGPAG